MGFANGGWKHTPTAEEREELRRILEGEGDHQLPATDDCHVGDD